MKDSRKDNNDKEWFEKNVLKEGEIFFYGSLLDDLSSISESEFWHELRKVAEEYLSFGNGRTALFHQKIDQLLLSLIERDKRYGYPPPFCHKGCCNCCHEVIYCTDEEAALIHDYCQIQSVSIDYEKIKRQLLTIEIDEEQDHTGSTTWNDQCENDQSCVFLDKASGACQIWEVRPFVCRVHLAEKTSEHCRPYNGQSNENAIGISYPEWSYVLTSIFTIHKKSIRKTMGRLLLM